MKGVLKMTIATIKYSTIVYNFYYGMDDQLYYICYDEGETIANDECTIQFLQDTLNHIIDMVGVKHLEYYTICNNQLIRIL